MRRLLHELEIPARRFRQRHGKDGSLPMNHVEPKHQRDAQARLFHGNLLQSISLFNVGHVVKGTELALFDFVFHAARKLLATFAPLRHLARLFFQCHFGKQRINLRFNHRIKLVELGRVRLRANRAEYQKDANKQKEAGFHFATGGVFCGAMDSVAAIASRSSSSILAASDERVIILPSRGQRLDGQITRDSRTDG